MYLSIFWSTTLTGVVSVTVMTKEQEVTCDNKADETNH